MSEKMIKMESSSSNEEESDVLIGNEQEKTRREIRKRYKNVAEGKALELPKEEEKLVKKAMKCSPALYSKEELNKIPKNSNLGLGSGNPVSLADIQLGETVVDLGSGAGVDCFLAANKVGDSGKVIGIDMTSEMIDLARVSAFKDNYENVEFRLGEIEHLPIANETVDLIISNCVINLASDKTQVFREAFRVLKPGGRLIISDIMFANELPEKVSNAFKGMAGCVSRAVVKDQYLGFIESVGFEDVEIINQYTMQSQKRKLAKKKKKDSPPKTVIIASGKRIELELTPEELEQMDTAIISAHVRAFKPKNNI